MKKASSLKRRRKRKQAPVRCGLCGAGGRPLPYTITLQDRAGQPVEQARLCQQCGEPGRVQAVADDIGWSGIQTRLRRNARKWDR